jgi:hypothetical protein
LRQISSFLPDFSDLALFSRVNKAFEAAVQDDNYLNIVKKAGGLGIRAKKGDEWTAFTLESLEKNFSIVTLS